MSDPVTRMAAGFATRFDLVESKAGGLLLDVETGAFYRLNPSAAALSASLRETGDRERTIDACVVRTGASRDRVARDVDALLALAGVPRQSTRNAVTFERVNSSLRMSYDRVPVLEIAHASPELEVRWIAERSEADVAATLLWAAPHLLVLGGWTVLHASAVERDGRVFAFTGESGAGKTTLARTFGEVGAAIVSEDLVVLDGASIRAVLDGERSIRAWVARRAPGLAEGRIVSGRELCGEIRGSSRPLAEVWFVDAARRTGSDVERKELEEIEGVAMLLSNSFAESGLPEVFRRTLSSSVEIARSARLSTVTVPDGIERLAEALRQLQ